jgi:hypothetical protein
MGSSPLAYLFLFNSASQLTKHITAFCILLKGSDIYILAKVSDVTKEVLKKLGE